MCVCVCVCVCVLCGGVVGLLCVWMIHWGVGGGKRKEYLRRA